MNTETPILERAFQIARSGTCAKTNDVRRALSREGYSLVSIMHITPSVSMQLTKLCAEARAQRQD